MLTYLHTDNGLVRQDDAMVVPKQTWQTNQLKAKSNLASYSLKTNPVERRYNALGEDITDRGKISTSGVKSYRYTGDEGKWMAIWDDPTRFSSILNNGKAITYGGGSGYFYNDDQKKMATILQQLWKKGQNLTNEQINFMNAVIGRK